MDLILPRLVGAAMIVLTSMLLGGGIQAAETSRPVDAKIASEVVGADNYPKVTARFAHGVTGRPDVTYATYPGFQPLKLDLYLPAAEGEARPLVIYVHGGGWVGGQSRSAGAFADFPDVLADLAARGYVVASINYRLSGEARFPAAADDVDAAIRWLKAHAGDYGIDKSRVAIWGGSAGGQLAGLAATKCDAKPVAGESDCVQAAVIWYGVFDFSTLPAGPAEGGAAVVTPRGPVAGPVGYLGCVPSACPAIAAEASPITFVDAKGPPMLLIHGDQDKTVPVGQSRSMQARLKGAGVSARYIELPAIDHSFIGATPEATRDASLKALRATFAFLDETVGR